MADRGKQIRRGTATVLGVGAVVGVGLAAERAFVRKDKARPDPYKDERYGDVRGEAIGPVATSDGTLLHVEGSGSGEITLALSHGFSLGCTLWHHQVLGLAGDARIVTFDHRGHGRSGRPPTNDWTLTALARDIDAVISDAAPNGRVVLVGHSMGGMAALEYARLFPEKIGTTVAGLVLVDTTAADVMGGMLPAGRRIAAALQGLQEVVMRALAGRVDAVDRLRRNGSTVAYLGTRVMGFGPNPSPSQVAFIERLLADTPSEVWLSLIPTIMGFDLSDVLPNINVPVLIIVGSHDRLTPPHAAERMAFALPQAELAVIEGAGHTSMVERPDEFNQHIREFLTRVEAASKLAAP
ncbi:MAG: alpha/beta fold hydrolase [Actinomycetota bacterium]